jgi:hypothetical protein
MNGLEPVREGIPLSTRRRARRTPQKQAESWGSLSKLLPERTRIEVVARFRARGGDFARWERLDREHLCNAMTATEDWIELQHPGWKTDRDELRTARRRLECELWP